MNYDKNTEFQQDARSNADSAPVESSGLDGSRTSALRSMKNIGILITAVSACIGMSGCSFGNMFKGPDDYYQNHHAESFLESIDRSILAEVRNEPPNGFKTKAYSPDLWQNYWNRRIFHILNSGFPESYVGPSEDEFVLYIVSERRKHNLPEIEYDDRTKRLIEQDGAQNGE